MWTFVSAECEAAGMRVRTSKSEAMVLCKKPVACSIQVGTECLPQVEEFKYLGVLFTSEAKMERDIDGRIAAAIYVLKANDYSPSGNRTPVFRVTGGDTVHYTNEEGHMWTFVSFFFKTNVRHMSMTCYLHLLKQIFVFLSPQYTGIQYMFVTYGHMS